ncbi:MAG: hypothetical protein ABSC50_03405 [Candidatus Bathyarchaeia archaeon]
MSGIPEVDMRIRKLVQAVFRSQGMLREYFTDLFPYMREALRHFNLEKAWETIYADVVTGDFELDRLSLFLNRLYVEDRQLFASFLGYVTKELFDRFHEPKENLTWFFEELKELGFSWDGKKKTLVPAEP